MAKRRALFSFRVLLNLVFTLPSLAYADTLDDAQIRFGVPTIFGSGCPAGSASASLSTDRSALSILFDRYQAQAGGITGTPFDAKSCTVLVPVELPEGIGMTIYSTQYRGFNSLPQGGSSRLSASYSLTIDGVRQEGTVTTQDFQGPLEDNFTVSADSPFSSGCGGSGVLEMDSSITVSSPSELALIGIDSADLTTRGGVVMGYRLRRCGDRERPLREI